MRQFRLKYADGDCSFWLNLEDYTIGQLEHLGVVWRATFGNYQIEYREV